MDAESDSTPAPRRPAGARPSASARSAAGPSLRSARAASAPASPRASRSGGRAARTAGAPQLAPAVEVEPAAAAEPVEADPVLTAVDPVASPEPEPAPAPVKDAGGSEPDTADESPAAPEAEPATLHAVPPLAEDAVETDTVAADDEAPADAAGPADKASTTIVEPDTIEPALDEPALADPAPDLLVVEPAIEPEPDPAPQPAARRNSARTPVPANRDVALLVDRLTKQFGTVTAVDDIDLVIPAGSFYGFVGPNGAGKTTTLSMISGLLRPDAGTVSVHGADIWQNPGVAKRMIGVLPDRLRLFDRLTGAEYLHHAGGLRGLDRDTVLARAADLVQAFGLEHSLNRPVADYSAGMVKKIAIAAAMIHSPRLLVLDEPFESVDPVSAELVIELLKNFTRVGGTVLLSSHSMHLIERVCDAVAIIAEGRILASGPMSSVLRGRSLEDRFVELAGGTTAVEGMEWLHSYSD